MNAIPGVEGISTDAASIDDRRRPVETDSPALTRRDFLVAASVVGGGMALSLLPRLSGAATDSRVLSELTPWIVIGADNIITVRVPGAESGTGNSTQAAMFVAEELPCAWSRVRTESLSFLRNAREGNLYLGATGIWATFAGAGASGEVRATLMQAGASARERLRAAGAAAWRVPLKEIEARDGAIVHARSGRRATYGELAARAATIQLPTEPRPKPPEQWTLLKTQKLPQVYAHAVVNGSARYGIDAHPPGALYAALMQCPVQGGRLRGYDFEAIRHMPGVRAVVVVDPDEPRRRLALPAHWAVTEAQSAVAVIADHYWQARQALDALPVTWDDGPGAQWKTTRQLYDAVYARLGEPAEDLVSDEGDAPRRIAEAGDDALEATYLTPFCEHATMEPLNGTALVTPDRVELWHPAGMAIQAITIASEETGVPPENIELHVTQLGGSFGRRIGCDDVRMVVAVAKKYPGTPIHVIWSREETFRGGRYRHLQAVRLRAALGPDGLPEALTSHVAGSKFVSFGMTDAVYVKGCIPEVRIESSTVETHVLAGQYRGPGYNSHCFFVESFIDECATRAGVDPLEYRLRLLRKWPDAAWAKCLEVAASAAGWGTPLPKGQGRGIAIGNFGGGGEPHAGTTVAAVATVEVDAAGTLTVHQVDIAYDCGQMLNRDAVHAQLEGSVIFGMNMCLNEELNLENGRIVEDNFHTYPMLRMNEAPRAIRIHDGALSGHERYANVGEPAVGVVPPAIANAIFAATGRRIRTMPFRKALGAAQASAMRGEPRNAPHHGAGL